MARKDLIPLNQRTKEEQKKIARKGGIASGKARREKKTIQRILSELLECDAKDLPGFAKIAKRAGVEIESEKSVKELMTMICFLNSARDGGLGTLESLMKLIGEETQKEDTNADVEKTLAAIKECAYADRDQS